MNILALIQNDGHILTKAASTHGGEYAGPCPFCSGSDRFRVWPLHKGGRYWCRGCDKTGDAIQYLRESHGLSFAEACRQLGIEKRGYKRKHSKLISEKPVFKPKKYEPPPDVWIQKAGIILKEAQERLWADEGDAARGFLSRKGLNNETIKRAELGCNPKELYRDRRGWGLPHELRGDGKPKRLWIPSGIVIPFQNDCLSRLRIRRNDPGNGPRYVIVSGSSMVPMIWGTDKQIITIIESELDGHLIWQEAGDLIGVVAMGNASIKPDVFTHDILMKAETILNALDYDSAGALHSWKFWPETYGAKVKRWPVPIGKDPADAWQLGLNIRAWILAGLSGG